MHLKGVKPDVTINPALVQVSCGTLPLSENFIVEQTGPLRLKFTWDKTNIEAGFFQDQVMLLAYNIAEEIAAVKINGQFRYVGEDELYIPSKKGAVLYLYAAFTAADRSRQSNSVYLGEFNVG